MKEIDIFNLPVHPAADVFPMLAEDELEELAEDIKENGLVYPIVIGDLEGKRVLVDGRNRREACKRAGVAPHTDRLNGQDPVAYIWSANAKRRNVTKGQLAMVQAKTVGLGYGKGKLQICNFEDDSPSTAETRLSRARTVVAHAPKLADQVIAGSLTLDAAYKDACAAKKNTETYETRFAELKAKAPDLADLVREGALDLTEAMAALHAREKEERQRKYDKAQALYKLEDAATEVLNEQAVDATAQFMVHERAIYEDYSKRPMSGLVHALEIFHENAGKVLARIRELTEENTDAS